MSEGINRKKRGTTTFLTLNKKRRLDQGSANKKNVKLYQMEIPVELLMTLKPIYALFVKKLFSAIVCARNAVILVNHCHQPIHLVLTAIPYFPTD